MAEIVSAWNLKPGNMAAAVSALKPNPLVDVWGLNLPSWWSSLDVNPPGIVDFKSNAQQQQMDQVRPTYESNSLADLYKRPDYTQQAWNPYGYDYAPPDYNADDTYGFGQTNMNQNTYGMG